MGREVSRLAPSSILEIGVGTGMALRRYPQSSHIHGIDVSEEMLAYARANALRLPQHRIELSTMDGENLSFEDNSFDCVTLPYVLSVTDNPNNLLNETRRVCAPNGHILVLNHFNTPGIWQKLQYPARMLGAASGFKTGLSYEETIGAHDWDVIKNKSVNLLKISSFVLIKNAKKV